MAEKQNERTPWADEIRRASASCEDAIRLLDELVRCELPQSAMAITSSLGGRLSQIRSALQDAFSRYSSEPSALALMGRELTGEQYHLVQAMIAAAKEADHPIYLIPSQGKLMTGRYTSVAEERNGVEIYSLTEAGTAVAEVAPSLGNNCFAFRTSSLDVLEQIPFSDFIKKPTSFGIPILFPFPNRIRDGRFTFGGQTYTVDPPRHGFVRDKPWQVVAHGASEEEGAWITSAFDAGSYPEILRQYPSSFRLEVTYRLRDGMLGMETMARNTGEQEMPVGFGIHPYFRKPAKGSVTVPADGRWELSDCLPTGRILPVEGDYDLRQGKSLEGLVLDDIFTGIEPADDGIASCVLHDREASTETVVEFPAAQFPHVVVYTPPAPRQAICIEPNTCPTDAFNLQQQGVESNVIVLGAGESVTFSLSIYARPSDSPAATGG